MVKGFIINGLKDFGIWVLGASYGICLTVAIVSVFIYIIGFKKAGKVATGSIVTYFILEAFRVALL